MNPKHLATLELPKILERVASLASFSASKELLLSLRPETTLARVRSLQAATGEAARLLASRPSTSIGGARDVRPLVNRASLGAVLAAGDLLEVQATIDSGRTLRELLHRGQLVYPELATYAGRLHPLKALRDDIAEAVNEQGEVVDSASPQLQHLRREVRSGRDRIMRRLEAIIGDPNNAEAIQEPIVTERNGRYVIAVKAAHRHHIRGVVHDQSESGATLFLEPLATVDMTNDWRQRQLEEQKEVERILRLLSNRVSHEAAELTETVEALAALDATFAKARYGERLEGVEPELNAEGILDLTDARHPLLSGSVVPQTIRLGQDYRVLIITGPNTGGKTVALKTAGLLTLMAQCGLRIPAASGSKVAVFEQVLADIGDEQSIEQSLSTFSGHLRNITGMLSEVGPRSLVLLDELGAGTDPDEGSELARALLEYLLDRGVSTIATTHYSELKAFAHSREGVENASVEFDVHTLSPTYRLRIGMPGRSNALAIAARLGVPDEIVENARGGLSEGHLRAESLLEGIHRKERAAARERNRATREQQQQRRLRAEAADALAEAERLRQEARDQAYEEAQAELEELRREAAALAQDLARARGERSPTSTHDWPGRREALQERLARAVRHGDRATARDLQAELTAAGHRAPAEAAGRSGRATRSRRRARGPADLHEPLGASESHSSEDAEPSEADRLRARLIEARMRGDREAARELQAQLTAAARREARGRRRRKASADAEAPAEDAAEGSTIEGDEPALRPGEQAILQALGRLDDQALEALREEIETRGEEAARQTIAAVQERVGEARQRLERQRPRAAAPEPPAEPAGPVAVGQSVRVPGFTGPGQVLTLPDSRGDVEVQVGAFRVRVRASELQRAPRGRARQAGYVFQRAPESFTPPSLSHPVDMRGIRADEVEPLLDRELNEAFSAGVPYLKIIHGHGSGIVRRIVRDYLAQQPYVSSFEPDSGDGATIVTLAI